jgi:hypothetical protein
MPIKLTIVMISVTQTKYLAAFLRFINLIKTKMTENKPSNIHKKENIN